MKARPSTGAGPISAVRPPGEEAAIHSEMVQRRFVANAPLAMAMFDRQMNYLAASPRWLRNYRLEGRELVGRSHYEVFPEIPERWKAAHRRSLAGEVLRMDADRFDRGDGSVQWLKWELRPWFKLSGEVGGITIGTEDITEHKRMEAALCESEENFRNVLATVADAVLVFDAETRKLVEFNEAAVRVYGYRPEELRQRKMLDFTAEPRASAAAIGQAIAGQLQHVSLRFHRKRNGTVFPGEIYFGVFVRHGRRVICAIVRDLAGRRQAEAVAPVQNGNQSRLEWPAANAGPADEPSAPGTAPGARARTSQRSVPTGRFDGAAEFKPGEPRQPSDSVPAFPMRPDAGDRARQIVATMAEYVQQHHHRPINLGDVAAAMRMNRFYLSTLFHQTTGTTFNHFLRDVRLAQARELLRDRRNRINEVAAAAGYASPDAFRHAFKAFVGLSPKAWRAAL
jgi:PAS domain S-box-containing protein